MKYFQKFRSATSTQTSNDFADLLDETSLYPLSRDCLKIQSVPPTEIHHCRDHSEGQQADSNRPRPEALRTSKALLLTMDPASIRNPDELICDLCRYPGSDLRVLGCGCTIHARCAPLSLVIDTSGRNQHTCGPIPPPNESASMPCPICRSGTATGLFLIPLCFRDIERAIDLRRESAAAQNQHARQAGEKQDTPAEASYLLLSSNRHALSDQHRTGRWTSEEIAYVDYLVSAFEQGTLPLPHGVKLNEFLGDMLICKSSRLTKKMKNAKLSATKFELNRPYAASARNDCVVLSGLQEKFLMSIPSEPTQLELRFNLTKQWRTHFSNLCVQVNYPFLDGKEWVSSLEEMERRAAGAEDAINRVRRVRMAQQLGTENSNDVNPRMFPNGIKADLAPSALQPMLTSNKPPETSSSEQQNTVRKLSTSEDGSTNLDNDEDMFDDMLDDFDSNNKSGTQDGRRPRSFSEEFLQGRQRTFSEDFYEGLSDLLGDPNPGAARQQPESQHDAPPRPPSSGGRARSPFLDAIITYMEKKDIPFQHADVWVPSFLPRDANGPSKAVDTEQLRLFHAGHATRGDLDRPLADSLKEFGDFSDKFSFEPGNGLPGRVYSLGRVIWETNVDTTNPKLFERSAVANSYGIKTAVGIPLNTPMVGRIVVAMYSCEHVEENMSLALDCASELVKYSPEPKWKLVIEMNDNITGEPLKAKIDQHVNNPATIANSSLISNLNSGIFNKNTKPPPLKLSQVGGQSASLTTQLGGCTSPTATNSESRNLDHEEQRIISLLGEHMPVSDSSAGEPSSSAANPSNLTSHFVEIRLLLLSSPVSRTPRQIEMIDTLKRSFRSYSKDNRRNGAELANLLAKDWICLSALPEPSGNSKRPATQSPIPAPPEDQGKRARRASGTNFRPSPMQPPTQFLGGRSSSVGYLPGTIGMQNMQQTVSRRNSSFEPNALPGRSNLNNQSLRMDLAQAVNSQRSLQPQPVKSNTLDDGDVMWLESPF